MEIVPRRMMYKYIGLSVQKTDSEIIRSLTVPPPTAVRKAKNSIPKKSNLEFPPIEAPVTAKTKVPK